jgi:hypothetical protein
VIHPVKKFLQVKIDTPTVTFGHIFLRLCHCLMSKSPRSKTVATFRKRSISAPF